MLANDGFICGLCATSIHKQLSNTNIIYNSHNHKRII